MKTKTIRLFASILLSGFCGIATHLISALILIRFPLTSFLFFPLLFGGIASIISMTIEMRVPFRRALVVGFISGCIYQLLSPIFPFISSILAGASLGGGLIADEGKLGDILNRLLSIFKGVFLLPVFIYLGGFILSLLNVFNSDFLIWFFWGAWIGLGICLISIPVFKTADTEQDFQTLSEVDEFKSEAQGILRELNQLGSRYK